MKKHLQRVRPDKILPQMLLQHDNARPHTSVKTRAAITQLGRAVLPHPPCSPALASSDFHLFGSLSSEGSSSRMMMWAAPSEPVASTIKRNESVWAYMPSFHAGTKLLNCMESTYKIMIYGLRCHQNYVLFSSFLNKYLDIRLMFVICVKFN